VKVIGWKIWYIGGLVFSVHDGKFCAAPKDGVLHMMVYYDKLDGQGRPTRLSFSGDDWYFSDGLQLFGSNSDSVEENKRRYPRCCFKQGKWATPEEVNRISKTAFEDYEI